MIKRINRMSKKTVINCFDEKCQTHLQIIINVVKIQKKKIAEQKQQLTQLLEEVKQFRNNYVLFQDYNKEIQTKIKQIFLNCLEEHINKFEQSLSKTVNLQQMQNESFKEYFDRIYISILSIQNEKKMAAIQQNKEIFVIFSIIQQLRYKISDLIIKTIYLQEKEEEGDDEDDLESNQKLGLFDVLKQKYKDFKNNDEWKNGLIFTIIYISSNCFTDTIISFCQKALIQLWILEKDQRVRNLLKNQTLVSLQMQILEKDWQTQHDRIADDMQQMLKRIDELQEQLKLITDFVNHIRKGLLRVEGKINQMKEQLNKMGNDIKFLREKSNMEGIEGSSRKNVKSIYVPLKTQEKDKNEVSRLMNFDQFYDKAGEVNEHWIWQKYYSQKKLKSLFWKLHDSNKKIGNYVLMPVYISLRSLKNPVFQAVEESLKQDDYGFDDLQLKECKEMLQKKEFRFIFIMDSYDEMKLENIQKNLYINNKLKQNWSDPLVIFTTRSDIFTSNNYADWFASEDKQKFKEIQLLRFEESQKQEYLKKFTIQSIKMLIFDIHEWQMQTQNQKALDFKRFEQSWEKVQSSLLKFDEARWKSKTLLNEIQIITQIYKKLWSFKKYEDMMTLVILNKLVETPYMKEIIVQVLPNTILKATEIINIKQTFLENFSKILIKFFISKYRIQMYKSQPKRHLQESINEVNKKSEAEIQVDYDDFQEVTHNDLYNLEIIDYHQIAFEVWNILEENLIPQQLQISQESEGHKQLQIFFETNLLLPNQILNNIKIQQEEIIQFVNDALKEYNLTIYDFYCEFINYYHLKQIEKQRNLGESIDTDRFMHDLLEYSIRFTKTMCKNQLTQVQYKQQGFLYQNARTKEQSLNEFFNYDDQNGAQKKDIRSYSLVQQKGANFQFTHKSIQEFLIAADLYEVFVQPKRFDTQILNIIIEILSQENNQDQDCLQFLENIDVKYSKTFNQQENISLFQKQKKFDTFKKTINSITHMIIAIKEHDINSVNFSSQIYAETRQYLIQKISHDDRMIEFSKFLVNLMKIYKHFIISGSNALNILVEMKVDLTKYNFQNIQIQNTSLFGGNFAKCNLSKSKFKNVNINGIN
ncbi:unnamed protein product [Paramecium pentaurelia]|uniref:Uncharacterized protein n=1 Tax=Paramecium pentaurelia TaxID=43138 RepID=A0A8S1TPB9_9CILI|nr:unnamed protein product [Paramecium pentaurelia]